MGLFIEKVRPCTHLIHIIAADERDVGSDHISFAVEEPKTEQQGAVVNVKSPQSLWPHSRRIQADLLVSE